MSRKLSEKTYLTACGLFVDIGEDKVDPLCDRRVAEVLDKNGMETLLCTMVIWSGG